MFLKAQEIREEIARVNEERVMREMGDWIDKINLAIQNLRAQALETGSTYGLTSFVCLEKMKDAERKVLIRAIEEDGYKVTWNPFVGQ